MDLINKQRRKKREDLLNEKRFSPRGGDGVQSNQINRMFGKSIKEEEKKDEQVETKKAKNSESGNDHICDYNGLTVVDLE